MSKLKFLYREELLIHRFSVKITAVKTRSLSHLQNVIEQIHSESASVDYFVCPDQALRSFYGTLQQLLRQSLRQPKECFRSRGLKLEFLLSYAISNLRSYTYLSK